MSLPGLHTILLFNVNFNKQIDRNKRKKLWIFAITVSGDPAQDSASSVLCPVQTVF